MRTVANAMMLPVAEYEDLIEVLPLRGNLRDIYGLAGLLEAIEPETYRLSIVDAWYRILPPSISENDNAAIAQVFNLLDQISDKLRCGVACIHHTSKGSQTDKRVTDVGSGAGSQSRAVDAHIVLREHREDQHAVLDAAVRSWPPVSPLVLNWEYPLWRVAEGLDPKALKTQQRRAVNVRRLSATGRESKPSLGY